ncbi:Transposase [Quadrisphaera granulorum]|uniref:Transposase n=1 Tax=Quadrisphaera granulorum TaxID=317664 RepID=A0A315ZA34_9ACTN|nr:IS110 family transposase [Quadrisphaera granulorum]PWJ42446.1 transposase [Quadrisphaera granulorum]SZE99230.1 Transposase [Quadrisphaera granulorum]
MDVIHERVAGIDISKSDIKVCVRIPAPAGKKNTRAFSHEVRTFPTTHSGLTAAAEWVGSAGVSVVAMESTGQYWKPVFYTFEALLGTAGVKVWLVNPFHIKKVPGRKSDVTDAVWIAQVTACGLINPSFVPDPITRQARMLSRAREGLVVDRTRVKQRIHDLLTEAGFRLSSVATDIFGISGRAMLAAVINGEADPVALAGLARGKLAAKTDGLIEAMTTFAGAFDETTRFLLKTQLERLDAITADIAKIDAQLEVVQAPFRCTIARVITLPGAGVISVRAVLAETGADMAAFESAEALCSWAGVCPGNTQSGDRRGNGATRPGNPHLKRALHQIAEAAVRVKDSYYQGLYQRLKARMDREKALMVIMHKILTAIWHMVRREQEFNPTQVQARPMDAKAKARAAQRLTKKLEGLGFHVALTDAEAQAA